MAKPILFNTEMVRAILEGRKTVTRRVVKLKGYTVTGIPSWNDGMHGVFWFGVVQKGQPSTAKTATCRTIDPPYQVGDTMWVRETWIKDVEKYFYRADFDSDFLDPCETLSGGYPPDCVYRRCDGCMRGQQRIRWHPSIHMPKEAARLFLRVTGVRVERLQNITEEGALAEGVPDEWPMDPVYCPYCKGEGLVGAVHPASLGYMEVDCPECAKATSRFSNLWYSTIKPADRPLYGWEANPWVWVIQFERCEKPEGFL